MEDGQDGIPNTGSCDAKSVRLVEALQKLESASALISRLIGDELAGSRNRETLERLYAVKGGLTCAIEETRNRRQAMRPDAPAKFLIGRT